MEKEAGVTKVLEATDMEVIRKDFDPFLSMDMMDDKLILSEIEGRVLDKWVYHFSQKGKEIWGLSKIGIDMACREMAKKGEAIREDQVIWEADPTDNRFLLFTAKASRVVMSAEGKQVTLDTVIGTKRQCLFMVVEGKITATSNNFWFEHGSIKSLRNARNRLISEEVRSKIVALAKSKGKVITIKESNESGKPVVTQPEQKSPATQTTPQTKNEAQQTPAADGKTTSAPEANGVKVATAKQVSLIRMRIKEKGITEADVIKTFKLTILEDLPFGLVNDVLDFIYTHKD